mgnify:CR=1 FL=1
MVEDHSSFKVVPSATNDVDFNSNKIINAGDVGIGTADPDAPLHITATGITGNQDRLVQLEQTTSDEGSIIILAAKDSGGTSQWWNIGPRETHNFGIGYSHDPGNNEFFTIKNDGNVGIGTTSPDELLDVEDVLFTQVGNVGIGTTSPQETLDVRGDVFIGDAQQDSGATVNIEDSASPYVTIIDQGTGTLSLARDGDAYIGWDSGSLYFKEGITWNAHPSGSGDTRMTILDGGNVGIGTTSPDELLDVEDGNIRLKSDHDGNTGMLRIYDATPTESGQIYGASGDLRIYSGADVLFTQVGNVGIGTTSPATSAKLEISSTTGALLMPRMTTAQRNALTAVNGMIIYNSTTNAFNFYENGSWVSGSGLV